MFSVVFFITHNLFLREYLARSSDAMTAPLPRILAILAGILAWACSKEKPKNRVLTRLPMVFRRHWSKPQAVAKRILFVAQCFDWVHSRGAEGRYHAANQGYTRKDERGDKEGSRIKKQLNIAGFRMFRHSAIQGESSD